MLPDTEETPNSVLSDLWLNCIRGVRHASIGSRGITVLDRYAQSVTVDNGTSEFVPSILT